MLSESPNFAFLASHSPEIGEIAARAEVLVLSDPQAALSKLRTFAEWLSNDILARNGVDGSELKPVDRQRRLLDAGLVPTGVERMLDMLRYWGNKAQHDHEGNAQQSLQALKTAHNLAIWFHRVVDGAEPANTEFLPPPDPSDATNELRAALDEQRQLAAALRTELELREGIVSTLEESRADLQQEAVKAWSEVRIRELQALAASEQLQRHEEASEQQIAEWKRRAAEATPPENIQAFIDRAMRAAERLGVPYERSDPLPLAQIRIQGEVAPCCNAVTLLVQKSPRSGAVRSVCTNCGERWNVGRDEFRNLDLWVACPVCGNRMKAGRPKDYYGYVCDDCDQVIPLASLVPLQTEL